MKTSKLLITMVLSCFLTSVYSQKSKTIIPNFKAVYNQIVFFQPGKYLAAGDGDSIKINILKFYISDISFQNRQKPVYKEKVRFHLVNVFDSAMDHIKLSKAVNSKNDILKFSVGIDSATNAAGALSGALDPVNGMYWTWQSGYIHFKLEGSKKHGNEKAQNFQYHIGGYQFPFNSVREITLKSSNNDTLTIYVDIEKLLNTYDDVPVQNIMSPGFPAMQLANQFQSILSIRKNEP